MKKYSKQRDLIYQTLCQTKLHPTAKQLYDVVRLSLPTVSLATVYRNLRELVAAGKAVVVVTGDGAEHFDGDVKRHSHLVCSCCHTIFDVEDSGEFPKDTPHQIRSRQVVYRGICSECLARAN